MWNCKKNVGVGDSDPRWGNDKCMGASWRSRNWSVTNVVLPIATVSGGSRPSPTRENKKPPRKGTENIMIPTHCAWTGCRGIPTKNTRYRTMKRYRAGSDGSAAGGRRSDLSEWQRSTDDDGISMPRRMSGTATGMGSNETGCTVYELAVGASRQKIPDTV